jgi:hypothetical protein
VAHPELKDGSTGEAVSELQNALNVPWLLIDGIFGPATGHVVRAWPPTALSAR